jgi:hypothetical protein
MHAALLFSTLAAVGSVVGTIAADQLGKGSKTEVPGADFNPDLYQPPEVLIDPLKPQPRQTMGGTILTTPRTGIVPEHPQEDPVGFLLSNHGARDFPSWATEHPKVHRGLRGY